MRTIWKYEIPHEGLTVSLINLNIRHVGPDPTGVSFLPHVWIEHSGEWPGPNSIEHRVVFIGTGMEVPYMPHAVNLVANFAGSCIVPNGLVWHVYHWQVWK